MLPPGATVKICLRTFAWTAVLFALLLVETGCRRSGDPARAADGEPSVPPTRRGRPAKVKETREMRVQVFGVSDGDTVTVRSADQTGPQFRVRLRGIDAPEKAQPFGQRAKDLLSELVFGKAARLVIYENDRYGRAVADIHVERAGAEVLVNLEMIRQGMAWHYARYDKRPEFAAAEREARAARRGLWADANPTPPWDWRRAPR